MPPKPPRRLTLKSVLALVCCAWAGAEGCGKGLYERTHPEPPPIEETDAPPVIVGPEGGNVQGCGEWTALLSKGAVSAPTTFQWVRWTQGVPSMPGFAPAFTYCQLLPADLALGTPVTIIAGRDSAKVNDTYYEWDPGSDAGWQLITADLPTKGGNKAYARRTGVFGLFRDTAADSTWCPPPIAPAACEPIPPCEGSAPVFDRLPVGSNPDWLLPIGGVYLPGVHQYGNGLTIFPRFIDAGASPAGVGSGLLGYAVQAPGRASVVHVTCSPVNQVGCTVYLMPCRSVAVSIGPLATLSPRIVAATGWRGESAFQSPGKIGLEVQAGEILGGMPDGGSIGLTYAVADARTQNHFANPARWTDLWSRHAACPVAGPDDAPPFYLSREQAAAQQALIHDGSGHRSAVFPCGTISQDIDGAASGFWFSTEERPDGGVRAGWVLALGHDSADPSSLAVDIPLADQSIPGVGPVGNPAFVFPMSHDPNSRTNVDFAAVSASADQASAIFCYDHGERRPFTNVVGGTTSLVFLIQVLSETRLEIEARAAASCDSLPKPWAFQDGVAVIFQR